ncbi:pentapeptide repeat-containing protein [Myxococcota bacterium]|nr:pentapeptide repeat-containing protein [Myxococcota bacterium]
MTGCEGESGGAADIVEKEEDGRFRIDGLARGCYVLLATAAGFESSSTVVQLDVGDDFELSPIVLRARDEGLAIRGRVRLGDIATEDTGHAGTIVTAGPFAVLTDDAGDFEVAVNASPPGGFRVVFVHEGYKADAVQNIEVDLDRPLFEIPEHTLTALTGGLRVSLAFEEGYFSPGRLPAPTVTVDGREHVDVIFDEETGELDLAALAVGRRLVSLHADGFETAVRAAEIRVNDTTDMGSVLLRASLITACIQGTAHLKNVDLPTGDAGVRVDVVGTPLSAITDEFGRYTIQNLPVRRTAYTVRFTKDGFEEATKEFAFGDQAGLDCISVDDQPTGLDPYTGRMVGTWSTGPVGALGANDPAIMAGVAIFATRVQAGQGPAQRHEAEFDPAFAGSYSIRNLPVGRYTVSATHAGGLVREARAVVDVSPGQEARVENLHLEGPTPEETPTVLAGRVERLCGSAACSRDVGAGHAGIVVEVRHSEEPALSFVGVTNVDGDFTVPVVAGRYDVTARLEAHEYEASPVAGCATDVEVTVGEVRNQSARGCGPIGRMRPIPGVLSFQIALDRFGGVGRVGGAVTRLTRAGEPESLVVRTPSVRETLDPGNYDVTVELAGYETFRTSVQVEPARSSNLGLVTLRHQSGTASGVSLEGRVSLGDGRSGEGVAVSATIEGADVESIEFAQATARPGGVFALTASPEERYALRFEKEGFESATVEVVWDPGQRAFQTRNGGGPIEVVLRPERFSATVVVPVQIRPEWVPSDQRTAIVTLVGGGTTRTEVAYAAADGTAEAAFNGLTRPGDYAVFVDQVGYMVEPAAEGVSVAVARDGERVVAPEITLRLVDFAAAGVELGAGAVLEACEVRCAGLGSLDGANLTGVRLVGAYGDGGEVECAACVDGLPVSGPISMVRADLNAARIRSSREELDCEPEHCGAANWRGVSLDDANATLLDAARVDLSGALMREANLFGASLAGANLNRADARQASFFGANLQSANLRGSNLTLANLTNADLWHATLGDRARVDAPCRPAGAPARQWPDGRIMLAGATLANANLGFVEGCGVDFSEVDLSGAQLPHANLSFSCLRASTLTLVDLDSTTLDGADMRQSRLTGSILFNASLRGTRLDGASLNAAVIERSDLRRRRAADDDPDDPCRGELPPWADYGVVEAAPGRCSNPDDRPADCNCRTTMRGANLNGTLIMGSVLDDVDLADASFVESALAESSREDVTPAERLIEPIPGCDPELYSLCVDFCVALTNESIPPGECASFGATCLETRRALGEPIGDGPEDPTRRWMTCAVRTYLHHGQDPDTLRVQREMIHGCRDPGFQVPDGWPEWTPWCTLAAYLAGQCPEATPPIVGTPSVPPPPQGRATLPVVGPTCFRRPTTLERARLDRSGFTGATLQRVGLRGASLRGTRFRGAILASTDFVGAQMRGIDFRGSSLKDANLSDEVILEADFTSANLTGASFRGSTLSGTSFSRAVMRDADLSETCMIYRDHDDDPGCPAEGNSPAPTFSRSDLSSADLSGARMQGVYWVNVVLEDAILDGVDFRGSPRVQGDLSRLDLRGVCGLSADDGTTVVSLYVRDAVVCEGFPAGDFRSEAETRPTVDSTCRQPVPCAEGAGCCNPDL